MLTENANFYEICAITVYFLLVFKVPIIIYTFTINLVEFSPNLFCCYFVVVPQIVVPTSFEPSSTRRFASVFRGTKLVENYTMATSATST